ncbi:MAG: hypothetical protein RLZZ628_2063 [Bacteroidota bacterium]|jgi:uncharacterized protein with ParB-like and HNH nuclease domain
MYFWHFNPVLKLQMEFITEQKVLNDLFGNEMTYIIPEYQRPYSWDCIGKSDKNNQVNVIWQDLIDFYESKNANIYFMGSMVVIGDGTKREYEVVDGQQRLTTLTMLLTAIKCFLNEIRVKKNIPAHNQTEFLEFIKASTDNIDKLIFNEKRNGLYRKPEKKVKIQKTIGFDYDNVLKIVMECGDISLISLKEASEEQKEVTNRYFKNRLFFIDQLKQNFLKDGIFTTETAENLDGFFEFLRNKVTILQIRAPKFDVAYQIFEILNNRGLPLSNKDLFRNFLISEFHILKSLKPDKYAHLDPNKKWRDLDSRYELNTEFVSRYVESTRGKSQQHSAFNDLQDIYKESFKHSLKEHKINLFYKDIEQNLAIYTKILNLDFSNKTIKNKIAFLIHSGNSGNLLNVLLTLFRNESDETQILDFLKVFEKNVIYMLLGTTKRFSTKPFYEAINELNEQKTNEAKNVFVLNIFELDELKKLLDEPIKDNEIGRAMLVKYYYALDSKLPKDVVAQHLEVENASLEHIIPQNPDAKTNWLTDFSNTFRKDYTYKLGNMTLLTQKMNSAARNFDFTKKKAIYDQTILAMTKEIAMLSNIDEAFIKKRHQRIVDAIVLDLEL